MTFFRMSVSKAKGKKISLTIAILLIISITYANIMLSVPYYQQQSNPQTPVITVSGAGASQVNGDYFEYSPQLFKNTGSSVFIREAFGVGEWLLTYDIANADPNDNTTYYSWVSDDTTFPIPVTGGTETVGTAGSAAFPTITSI